MPQGRFLLKDIFSGEMIPSAVNVIHEVRAFCSSLSVHETHFFIMRWATTERDYAAKLTWMPSDGSGGISERAVSTVGFRTGQVFR